MTKEECLEILDKLDGIESNPCYRFQLLSTGSPFRGILEGGEYACLENTKDVLVWISEMQEFLAALTSLLHVEEDELVYRTNIQ